MITSLHSDSFRRRGFTLIEVLVTTSLFSIVMSVLLVGVFSGTRAWDQADRHLERRTRVRTALEQFRQDVETAQMSSDESGGVGTDAAGRPTFQALSLETKPGSPWSGATIQVEWSLTEDGGELAWTRKSQPMIGESLVGSPGTELMIEEVDELEIELRQGGTWLARIDPEGPAPDLLRLTVTIRGGKGHQLVLHLRSGEISDDTGSGDDSGDEDQEEGLEDGPDDEVGDASGGEVL